MAAQITFFDIPSNHPKQYASSPYTWRVRLALNYKGLPYTTVWAPIDQIESVCKDNSLPQQSTNPDGTPKYTFPCLIDHSDPDNVIRITDSRIIIEHLEKTYPNPPLNPNSERAKSIEQYVAANIAPHVAGLVMKEFFRHSPPATIAHYERVVPRRWGKSLEDALGECGDEGSAQREGLCEELKKAFEGLEYKNGNGWLGGGDEPQYEDLVVLGFMMLLHLRGGDAWTKLQSWSDGKWKRYWYAAEKYIVVK